MMLPISALLFIFQCRFYLYRHATFSLHSFSALGLMIILAMATIAIGDDWGSLMLVPAPIHLFGHMRGVYRTSVMETLARMVVLFLGSAFAAGILIVGLIAVGLNGMGA